MLILSAPTKIKCLCILKICFEICLFDCFMPPPPPHPPLPPTKAMTLFLFLFLLIRLFRPENDEFLNLFFRWRLFFRGGGGGRGLSAQNFSAPLRKPEPPPPPPHWKNPSYTPLAVDQNLEGGRACCVGPSGSATDLFHIVFEQDFFVGALEGRPGGYGEFLGRSYALNWLHTLKQAYLCMYTNTSHGSLWLRQTRFALLPLYVKIYLGYSWSFKWMDMANVIVIHNC